MVFKTEHLESALQQVDRANDLSLSDIVDIYVTLSEASSLADDKRKDVGDILDQRMDGDEAEGERGAVQRYTRTYWSLRSEAFVKNQLRELGVDPVDVMSIDEDKLNDVIDDIDAEKEDFYDKSERSYIRKK
jgi:hypothetical protein